MVSVIAALEDKFAIIVGFDEIDRPCCDGWLLVDFIGARFRRRDDW
jgi:hypothetical protein